MQRLSESLKGQVFFGVAVTEPAPRLEWLLPLAETATYQQRLEALNQAEKQGLVLPGMPREILFHRAWFANQRRRQTDFLVWAQQRDAIQVTRPEGCWCLGLGHCRRDHGYSFEVVMSSALQNLHDYCECPDGRAAFQRHHEARSELVELRKAERLERLWGSVGIPADHETASFERFVELAREPEKYQAAALVQRLRLWQAADNWLVLWGPAGRGKSALSCCLAREAAQRGQTVLWAYVPALLDKLRATHDPDGLHRSDEVLGALYSLDLLVLDDLGAERVTGYVQETVRKLITERHANNRRTIVTTNLDPLEGEFAARLGEPVVSRILGKSEVVAVAGDDLRITQRMAKYAGSPF